MISTWSEPRGSRDALRSLIGSSLPLHREFLDQISGYSGSVVVAGRNAWTEDLGEGATRSWAVSLVDSDLVEVDGLADAELEKALHRAANRSRGSWDPEP